MEALRLKNYILIILMILTLISCTKGDDKMEIIAYGTPEFEEFIKNAPISPMKAKKIRLDFSSKNTKFEDYNKKSSLFFIVNNHYVFTLTYISKMKLKGELLTGIWVNSISGVKYITDKTIIEAPTFRGWIE